MLCEKMSSIESECAEMRAKITLNREELHAGAAAVEELSAVQVIVADLEKTIDDSTALWQRQAAEKDNRLKQLTEKLDSVQHELGNLQTVNGQFSRQVQEKNTELEKLIEKEKLVHMEVERQAAEIESLKSENGLLKSRIEELFAEIMTVNTGKDTLKTTVHLQTEEIIALKNEKKILNNKIKEITADVSIFKSEKELLNSRIMKQSQEISSTKQENEELNMKLLDLSQSGAHDNCKSNLNEVIKEGERLKTRIADLKFVVKSLENENSNLKRLQRENKILNSTVNEALQRNAELLADLENHQVKKKQAEIQLKELNAEVEMMRSGVSQWQSVCADPSAEDEQHDSGRDSSGGHEARLVANELALGSSLCQIRERDETLLLLRSNLDDSKTAVLTLRDQLREVLYHNMNLTCDLLSAGSAVKKHSLHEQHVARIIEEAMQCVEDHKPSCTGDSNDGDGPEQTRIDAVRCVLQRYADSVRSQVNEQTPDEEEFSTSPSILGLKNSQAQLDDLLTSDQVCERFDPVFKIRIVFITFCDVRAFH